MSGRSRMLRIVHVPGLDSLKYGSFERFMLVMARECRARGHRFHVVWESRSASEAFVADLAGAGALSIVMPARGRTLWFIWQLARWLSGRGIHVVHAHFNPAAVPALVAARLAQVPLPISTIRSGLFEWQVEQGLPMRSRLVAMVRRSFSARVLTVSDAVAEQYRRVGLGGGRMRTRYTGITPVEVRRDRDEARREFGFEPDELVLACVAFHHPVKGVDVLLRALALLAAEFPRLRLLQVGGTPEPEETVRLKRLAEDLGVADRVVWTGHRDDVPDLLAAGDLYCQPSRSEGLPKTVLEAMDAELAVVATDVVGTGEAVAHGETGLLVPPESPERLAVALADLLRDEPRRRRMGRRGRQRVRRQFVLEEQTARLVDLYEQMYRAVRR